MKFLARIFDSKTFGFLFSLAVIATLLLIFGKIGGEIWASLIWKLGGAAAARGAVPDNIDSLIRGKKNEIEKATVSESDIELARSVERSTR